MRIDKWIGYIFGAFGLIFGAIRHAQSKKTKRVLSEQIRGLKKKIDPESQESQLNQYGETYDDD